MKKIKFYLGYIFYWFIIAEDRRYYEIGKIKGYHCVGSRDDSYVVYGSARVYEFDLSKPPTRNYLTFSEYKKLHYPIKQ